MPDFLSYFLCSILLSYFMSHLFCPTCSCPIFCLISLGWSDLFLTDFFLIFRSDFMSDFCPIIVRFSMSDLLYPIFLCEFFCPTCSCPILLSYFLCPISCSIFCSICCHIFGGDFSSKKIEHVSCIATFVMYCQCVKSFYYYDSIVSRHVWVSSRAIIVLWLLVSYSSSHQWHRT